MMAAVLGASLVATPATARAFCGFYVGGADAKLYNNATMVVLMREGPRTVLAMQNNYEGPPEDFAMVVPVPVVLREVDVRTLEAGLFERVDRLAAPRLVEYWEQDPCGFGTTRDFTAVVDMAPTATSDAAGLRLASSHGVTVEARFAVGEYKIEILGAKRSTGLDTWLREHGYKLPAGAERALRPYVQQGIKFFVAKVDIKKVRRDGGGRVLLSPLRFHYDSESFSLPVRLGLLNSNGTQDLIVHLIGKGLRYQAANYTNVTIPTNLDLTEAAKDAFGRFYVALFDRVQREHPGAVVTEYAWSAGDCDPCPDQPLSADELALLGGDVLPGFDGAAPGEYVLTRLHARYGAESLGEDLVFGAAPAIVGGREQTGDDGRLEQGARQTVDRNNFQARYAVRHAWTGPIACEQPVRGIWGGQVPTVARELAFVPRDAPLTMFLQQEAGADALADVPADRSEVPASAAGCGRCDASGGAGLFGVALAWLRRGRRGRRRGAVV